MLIITYMKYFSILIFQIFQTKYKAKIFAPAQFAACSVFRVAMQQQTYTSPAINVKFR
jgi:hypothetical protein